MASNKGKAKTKKRVKKTSASNKKVAGKKIGRAHV